VLVLALLAALALIRRRLEPHLQGALFVLGLVALAAFISSAPPHGTVLGVNVPFPSDLIMKVTTTWRVYSRFVALVMVALVSMAAVGLHVLTRGRRLPAKVAMLLVAAVAIPLDLWEPGKGTNAISEPADYVFLAHQPHGLTAEYPLVPSVDSQYNDVFNQYIHGNPMINGYGTGTLEEKRAMTLANLSDPSTAGRLASLGVRYVIVEPVPPLYGLPAPGTPRTGFQRLYQGPSGSVYRVTARPAGPALPTVGAGFADTETLPDHSTFNWMVASTGTIELAGGTCRGCRGILGMTVSSFARPRTVVISMGRRVLLRRRVAAPTRLQVPLTYRGIEQLTISATPGPQSIHATTGSPDYRSVSLGLGQLSFVWPSAAPSLRR
jgi:hypothetical protein